MGKRPLSVDEERIKAQAESVQSAAAVYKAQGSRPFDAAISALSGMNTDFLAQFKTMLGDLNDSNSDLITALEEIGELAQAVVETFEEVDETAADEISAGKEG